MREIKFRAHIKETGKICKVISMDFNRQWVTVSTEKGIRTTGINWVDIIQYTGLKDSNNTEGYEGDISEDFSTGEKFKIEFVDGAFTLVDKNGVGQEILDLQCQHIIGNIYITPDLKEQS